MAVKNRAVLIQEIVNLITDNGNNEITGEDVRNIFIDVVDSCSNLLTDNAKFGLKNYDENLVYLAGETVVVDLVIYQCKEDNTTGAFDSSKWNVIGEDTKAFGNNADQNLVPLEVSTNGGDTGLKISDNTPPNCRIDVFVSGLLQSVGDGSKNKDFYFSRDNGATAQSFADVKKDDKLFFNSIVAGFVLTPDDLISINYDKIQ